MAVVVQIMDIHLKTSPANSLQKSVRNSISFLGDHLEGTFDPVAAVQIHQAAAKIPAFFVLDIVSHDHAALILIRPEPDEGDPPVAVCPADNALASAHRLSAGLSIGQGGNEIFPRSRK